MPSLSYFLFLLNNERAHFSPLNHLHHILFPKFPCLNIGIQVRKANDSTMGGIDRSGRIDRQATMAFLAKVFFLFLSLIFIFEISVQNFKILGLILEI